MSEVSVIRRSGLTVAERELAEERAAIMEFDGNLEREEAERLAVQVVKGARGKGKR